MTLFMIERTFAESLDPSEGELKAIGEANASSGVRWLHSFLSADKRRTYCLYEAASPEVIREAARRAGLPADLIIELSGELSASGFRAFHEAASSASASPAAST